MLYRNRHELLKLFGAARLILHLVGLCSLCRPERYDKLAAANPLAKLGPPVVDAKFCVPEHFVAARFERIAEDCARGVVVALIADKDIVLPGSQIVGCKMGRHGRGPCEQYL